MVELTPLTLQPLGAVHQSQALQAHDELAQVGFEFLLDYSPIQSWVDYIARLRDIESGINLPRGYVPASFRVAMVGPDLVGRVSIRHQLNGYLEHVGGHIGYAVRPQFRGRGYATAILRLALHDARDLRITTALVTADVSNTASCRVIEKCGGVLRDIHQYEDHPEAKCRYDVQLAPDC